jgi:ribosomal protein S18 acetylase RimI-like enzyme
MGERLDNPVWHALIGPHARFAHGQGLARHYPRDMAPFSGIERASPAAYADLAIGLPSGTEARLFRPCNEPLPDGWVDLDALPLLQMVAEPGSSKPFRSSAFSLLAGDDLCAMMDLVAVAKPGPFGPRTPELGTYIGIWKEGRLIAMAGERLRVPGYVELSAICTHPDARGRGFASLLTQGLMAFARTRGEIAFLHVRAANKRAVSLYERLGFRVRREIWVLWRKPPGTAT